MRKQLMIPALLAMSVALAACATKPNPNLEQARSNFTALQTNPEATKVAALETKDASEWLAKAEQAFRNDDDVKKVDQLSYLTNQRVELAKQTIALRTSEAALQNAYADRAKARLEARDAQIAALKNSLNAKQTERGTLVTFGDVLFDYNKADLKPTAQGDIGKLAAFLQENPDRKVIVEGYTDSTGDRQENLKLSKDRAQAVADVLMDLGVDEKRIHVEGYGQQFPVNANASERGRAQNRRVEILFSDEKGQLGAAR
ncbi:OmpA family protein [Pseudomonas amygdali]|uniref:OmpA family protein n=1 Tax=Pseudomonas amygdali TaxID=47877 RepID=UPI000EFDE644|nr:OmpA family protein [Pseudomonas amygdali]RMV75563.1 OmpA protein [Pseudomonas amygdali pv. sesami]